MKKNIIVTILCLLIVVAAVSISYIVFSKNKSDTIEYRNNKYGFIFELPKSWKGYSIIEEKWNYFTYDLTGNEVPVQGPEIFIRHPEWTSTNPRQDIPIMVFTIEEWNLLQDGKYFGQAAPIPPSELGRNSNYVFALPPRYNFAYLTGWEEVENIILNNTPLHTF